MIQVTHPFVSGKADGGDASVVRASNWNAAHTVTGAVETIVDNTTKTVASTGADFTTLAFAFQWLRGKIIQAPYFVTFSILGHTATGTTTVSPEADYSRVRIVGPTVTSLTLSSIASSGGSSGYRSYVLNLSSVGTAAVGDYVSASYLSGGTNPRQLIGCHGIEGVSGNQITVRVRNNSALVASGAVTGTFRLIKASLGQLIFAGSNFGLPLTGSGYEAGSISNETATIQGVAIQGIRAQSGAKVWLTNNQCFAPIHNGGAIAVDHSLLALPDNYVISGHWSAGDSSVAAINGSTVLMNSPSICPSGQHGVLAVRGSTVLMPGATVTGGSTNGLYAHGGSFIKADSVTNDGATAASPVVNTVGNSNAYISTASDFLA